MDASPRGLAEALVEVLVRNEIGRRDAKLSLRQLEERSKERVHVAPTGRRDPGYALQRGPAKLRLIGKPVVRGFEDHRIGFRPVLQKGRAKAVPMEAALPSGRSNVWSRTHLEAASGFEPEYGALQAPA